mgnify:FL=1
MLAAHAAGASVKVHGRAFFCFLFSVTVRISGSFRMTSIKSTALEATKAEIKIGIGT